MKRDRRIEKVHISRSMTQRSRDPLQWIGARSLKPNSPHQQTVFEAFSENTPSITMMLKIHEGPQTLSEVKGLNVLKSAVERYRL